MATAVCELSGLNNISFEKSNEDGLVLTIYHGKTLLGTLSETTVQKLQQFDIKQAVYVLDLNFTQLEESVAKNKIRYKEVNKFPVMQRDLAMVVARATTYESIEQTVKKVKLPKLKDMRLFDVFESEKLGADKKSMAISFLFSDDEKTLTDKEVDGMVSKLVQGFENDLSAEIRK